MHHPVQTIPEAPLVSIIVPVYNLETCVSSCLDSLLRQTWSPLEIILVNDGSTDRTAHILNAYAARHQNIRVITRENAGVDAARYAGMDMAAGEYVMFVDGDDAIFPDSVEAMAQMAVRERADVRGMARSRGISIEEAARDARQALFLKWAAGYPGAFVALAHHRNDQQETALLHLCRGASGIHGMSPVSTWANGLTVVRPLLDFSRKDITAYLEHRHIPWREDSSNQSAEYTRNALRHEVIPRLDTLFQRDTSLSFSRACRIENQIRTALSQALDSMNLADPQGRLFLPKVNQLPAELRQCAVHDYLRRQHIPDLTEDAVLRVMSILDTDGPSRTSLPGGKLAVRKEKRLMVTDAPRPINKGEQPPAGTAGGI